ncbi:MAG: TetR/AcrR family transcriptional regulator [Pseudomonadota bacterium]
MSTAHGDAAKQTWRNRRSEETRRAVIEAAVHCLVEQGYANTTTQLVADQVGLSRGAMNYHYATRTDLIGAVIDYIFLRLLEMAYDGVERREAGNGIDMSQATDLQWSVINSAEYIAYIELNIAARTDADLQSHFDKKAVAFDQLWLEKSEELLPLWEGDRSNVAFAWNFTRATLEGLKINERIVRTRAGRKRIRDGLIAAMMAFQSGKVKIPE